MSYIVVSSLKEHLASSGMQCAGDLPEVLNNAVENMLNLAVGRATDNGRKTVRPCDL